VEQRDASDNNDFIFPSQELLNKAEDNFASKTSALIQIPAGLIQGRGSCSCAFQKICVKLLWLQPQTVLLQSLISSIAILTDFFQLIRKYIFTYTNV